MSIAEMFERIDEFERIEGGLDSTASWTAF